MPHFTLGEHFGPVPSPKSTTPHTRGTLPPNSVAQGGRAARSGNISARFRRPRVPRRTPGEHFCPIPLPNSTAPHTRGTFLPLSVAQRCISARPGNTSATIRRPTGHYRTLGEHFRPFPSPKGAAAHALGTLLPHSVAQRCRAARPGDTYARFRRRGGRGKGNGRGGRARGTDGRRGRAGVWGGVWAGDGDRHGNGNGHGDGNGDGDGHGHKSSRR